MIKLHDDSVYADVLRARATLGLGDKVGACAIIVGVAPRATRDKDILAIASTKKDAGCPSIE
jgi:hypothetical protein